jgi:glutaconate CoA-transferase, subunit B
MDTSPCKPSERMAVRAAAELHNREVVFVGIGLPNLACNLARATHAPELFMIYESGAVGTLPDRLPVSIGDPTLVTDSLAIVSQSDIFQLFLQGGLIEVGFLGGAQLDRFGNLNTTVIGDYTHPKVRLPGSGGACEIATHSQRLLIMMKMNARTFVPTIDFVTSPGQKYESKRQSPQAGKSRKELGLAGGGPATVITDLGVCQFVGEEMVLTEIYSGVTKDQVRAACGWDLQMAETLIEVPPPSEVQIRLLRDKLDPQSLYL